MQRACARCGKHFDLTYIANPRGMLRAYYLCGDCISKDMGEYGYEARAFLYRQKLQRRTQERRAGGKAAMLQIFRSDKDD